jgi:phytoene dehydrogenase-like protein
LQDNPNCSLLLLEQHETVGGHLAGFTRKGYRFDSGVNSLPWSFVEEAFGDLGILEQVNPQAGSVSIRLVDRPLPLRTVKDFFDEASRLFPGSARKIRQLYKSLRTAEALNAWLMKLGNPYYPTGARLTGRLARMFSKFLLRGGFKIPGYLKPFEEYLTSWFPKGSPEHNFFTSIIYSGISTFMYVGLLMIFMGQTYPAGGMQVVTDALSMRVTKLGGTVRCNTKVTGISVSEGVCMGVTIQKGDDSELISGRFVISAIDLKRTLINLLDPSVVPLDLRNAAGNQVMSETIPVLYLGVKIPVEEIHHCLGDATHHFYQPGCKRYASNNSDTGNESSTDPDYYKNASLTIFSPSIHSNRHAPGGCSSIVVHLGFAPKEWMQNWGLMSQEPVKRYREIKKMVTEQVLERLQEVIPGLEDRSLIEVCELGTPRTIERYTGNHGGASSGFSWRLEECLLTGRSYLPGDWFTTIPGISGLRFIGHQTVLNGGIPGALVTARHCAVNSTKELQDT